MPARKTTRTSSSSTTARRVDTTSDISYETKVVIVILLLLFVYPLGLIFMWFWMRNWPLWLKIIISLPVVFGILAIIIGMFFFALLFRHAMTSGGFQNRWDYGYERPYMRGRMMPATPSATVMPSPTSNPDNSGTY